MIFGDDSNERAVILKYLMIGLIAIFAFSGLKSCVSLPSWLGGQTKEEVVAINKVLVDQVKDLTTVNQQNEQQHDNQEKAKEASDTIYNDTQSIKKDIVKNTSIKKVQYKKKIEIVQNDPELTEEQKTQQVIEASADAIWDSFCAARFTPACTDI